ncbi:MAG: peptidoglycan DD-metalloendopeptidase family protein [Pseudomonadota bacterium]
MAGVLAVVVSGCSSLTIPDVVTPVKRVLEPLGRSFDTRAYVVQPGDNLAYIAWRYQTTVDELLAWNGLNDATGIRPGQAIQVRAPRGGVVAQAPQQPARPVVRQQTVPQPAPSDTVTSPVASAEPLQSQLIVPVQPRDTRISSVTVQPAPTPTAPAPAVRAPQVVYVEPVVEPEPVVAVAPTPPADDVVHVRTASRDGLQWAWPQRGKIVKSFSSSDTTQQGIDIAAGSAKPIRAAADGIVAFAGNEVSVLGRTIIIDHQREFLSAYAKVGKLLVEEGESVRVGDVIAETDAGGADGQFHFQIRRKGVPLNPLKYLPKGT